LSWYREEYQRIKDFGRTKLDAINQLINREELASLDAVGLTTGQLVRHAFARASEGTGPATINNDFVWLRVGFRAHRIGNDSAVDERVVDDAAVLCRKEGLIAKGRQRDRRPTFDEMVRLLEYFSERDGRAQLPMVDIVLFAMTSSRRQDEICRINWSDLDRENSRVLVRDMKHPKQLIDTWTDLPPRAMRMIDGQSEVGERIFPFNGKSVSAAFTRACNFLAIDDLRFHDLRHEATSCLFELGLDIPFAAKVTGHKSWSSLQRYTQIEKRGDKWATLLGFHYGLGVPRF
jgi:integrase